MLRQTFPFFAVLALAGLWGACSDAPDTSHDIEAATSQASTILRPAENGGPAYATYLRGMEAFAAGNGDAALDQLEEAIVAEPDNLRYGTDYRQVVIALAGDDKALYDRSMELFEELTEAHPEADAAWLNLGFAHVDRIPVEGAITQVLVADRAVKALTRALEAEESWVGLYTRGNALLFWPPIFGRTEAALRDLERAIDLGEDEPEPYHARAWAAVGDGHWRLGDSATARDAWRQGLERFPGDPLLRARDEIEDDTKLDALLDAHYAVGQRVATHLRELFDPDHAQNVTAFAVRTDTDPAGQAAGQTAGDGGIRFEEIAAASGVRFVHTTRSFAGRHKHQVLEMFTDGGAAVAVGDYNRDGWEDLYITESDLGRANHLMRNDGPGDDGRPRFTEVTDAAGVGGGNDADSIVGEAVWLDYDNDGRLDLYLGRFGIPVLYHNLGCGSEDQATGKTCDTPRFEDVAAEIGLTTFGNTIATITFDADADGWLDLLLANYFQPVNLLDLETDHVLPNNLDDAENGGGLTFYHNVELPGGGRGFVDRTADAGFAHHTGWSLDLGHADLDNDGDQDVYVAGDYGTDRLFLNRGDGTFDDVTETAIGFDTRKGMNVDMADYNRDGFLDIYVTNITDEYMKECNMLWHNLGDGTFMDLSRETGTCDTDWGWAGKFGDFDNDGWEDLFVVNGLRSRDPEKNYIPVLLDTTILADGVDFTDLDSYPDIQDMTWSGYQKQRFFRNLGDGTFREIAAVAGVDNDLDGRGIGVGDFDNDGRLDFYQSNANQESLLYRGVTADPGHWVVLRLVGTRSNRDAIGARATLTADGTTQIREVNGGNGYAGQSSYRLHFGLGAAEHIEHLEIRWPDGTVENLDGVPVDAISTIIEGKGIIEGEGIAAP